MTHTILLDADRYAAPRDLHAALALLLALPEHYGMNADALYDCLSERRDTVSLWLASRGEGETARALETVCQVVEDLGGTVKEL